MDYNVGFLSENRETEVLEMIILKAVVTEWKTKHV